MKPEHAIELTTARIQLERIGVDHHQWTDEELIRRAKVTTDGLVRAARRLSEAFAGASKAFEAAFRSLADDVR